MKHLFRVGTGLFIIAAGTFPLAGCMSPTYGTDKSAAEQLLDDVGNAVAVGAPQEEKNIAYKPRPELVVPSESQLALVEPQQSLANRENNPNWVESPEELRKRLRKEATEANDGDRANTLIRQKSTMSQLGVQQQKDAYSQQRNAQGASTGRRSLVDPPKDYRRVSDPSVLTDLGESEKVKEKRRKKEAEAAQQGKKWWDPLNVF
ncbi:hypothetical protein [Rhizobium sp. L1K21]|uniref:hypothetical protein n=1 Tax=Rhizobium sp. L1K21 TaxID=2954933 RepID=UPI002093009B|nr:hypothetical protein [Rhizobium sp. L1K21]MCO6186974.1 hypothetical protein [Rhizobium sp. L1K21]